MADKKFSALDPATLPLSGTEIVPIIQGGVPKRTTVDDILANDEDPVLSVNGQNGDVTLTQDDIGDGTTYKQYSATEKTKLAAISGTNTGDQDLSGKQDVLVSGANIKTVNGASILGSGDLVVSGSSPTNYDGGNATSVYGGAIIIDGGTS